MTIGFDFDGTLNSSAAKRFFSIVANDLNQHKLIVITNRIDIDKDIVDAIKEIGLNEVMAYAIGDTDYKNKAAFIADEELEIDFFFENDNIEIEAIEAVGVSCFKVPRE